jgi:hypothetical protein
VIHGYVDERAGLVRVRKSPVFNFDQGLDFKEGMDLRQGSSLQEWKRILCWLLAEPDMNSIAERGGQDGVRGSK